MTEEPDLSAFWLYPDWDGPLKEPFWMRPLKLPPAMNYSGSALVLGAAYIDLGAVDYEGKAMTRVVTNPMPGQYVFDAERGWHLARSNRPWRGRRLWRKPDGSLDDQEICYS